LQVERIRVEREAASERNRVEREAASERNRLEDIIRQLQSEAQARRNLDQENDELLYEEYLSK
jgi:hypothetical protein